MNNRFIKTPKRSRMSKKKKNLILTIVILLELVLLGTVASFAWVETVSSIKINNFDTVNNQSVPNTKVKPTMVSTRVHLTDTENTVDLGEYFRQGGDMHLTPASSTNGTTFFFPETVHTPALASGTPYREGNLNDKNTTYLSVTFELSVEAVTDIYFTQDPSFGALNDDIRVAVVTESGDDGVGRTSQMFYKGAANSVTEKSESVVASTSGQSQNAVSQTFYKYCAANTDREPIFSVNANETKTVTINIWLQKKANDMSSNLAQALTISNFGLTSSQVPRKITLFPSAAWKGTGQYYYLYCFDNDHNIPAKLYQAQVDEDGHYYFTYNAGFPEMLFFRSTTNGLQEENMSSQWGSVYKTDDLYIPKTPLDLTYVITSTGSAGGGTKAGVSLIDPAAVTINIAHYTGQTSAGTITATTYTDTSSTNKMEESNNTANDLHNKKVHGWSGKNLTLSATPASGWRFVGWYTNAACTGTSASTSATYTAAISAAGGTTVNYYAKFQQTRTITLNQYVKTTGSSYTNTDTGAQTLTLASTGATQGGTVANRTITVDKGATVTMTATANSGFTFDGFFDVSSGGTALSTTSPYNITANANAVTTNYYARFHANTYTITAHARHSTDGSSTYSSSDTTTGGTVLVSTDTNTTPRETSTGDAIYTSNNVTLTATAASGYKFDGWYTAATGGSKKSSDASWTYNFSTTEGPENKVFYARFTKNQYTVTAKAYYSDDNGSTYNAGSNGGTVEIGSSGTASATASTTATVNGSNVSLTASAAGGYEFVGWYDTSGNQKSTNSTYSYQLTSYSNVELRARFKKVLLYLTGWINGSGVSTTDTTRQFQYSSGSNYTLSYKFTGHHADDGKQYVTIYTGTTAYHPTMNAGSGTAYSTTDTSPADGYKWLVPYCKGTTVNFTWNHSNKSLSWTISSRVFYLKPNTNWKSNSARFAVYAWKSSDDSQNAWYNLAQIGTTDCWVTVDSNGNEVGIPAKYDRLKFCRMKGDSTSNSFDNPPCWNKTNELWLVTNKNLFEINDWSSGSWSRYS